MKSIYKISFEECCFVEAASKFFDFNKDLKKSFRTDYNLFESTHPLDLAEKYKKDPFLFLEYFFNVDGLAGHKKQLRKWFKAVLSENKDITNAKDFLFFHNMFTQLLNAGCIIVNKQIRYSPKKSFNNETETFVQWLGKIQDNSISTGDYYAGQFEVSVLSIKEKNNPYLFLQNTLTFNKVQKLRYGMLEWLYASVSKENNIGDLDPTYLFEQYELMNKFIEAFYVIIMTDNSIELLN